MNYHVISDWCVIYYLNTMPFWITMSLLIDYITHWWCVAVREKHYRLWSVKQRTTWAIVHTDVAKYQSVYLFFEKVIWPSTILFFGCRTYKVASPPLRSWDTLVHAVHRVFLIREMNLIQQTKITWCGASCTKSTYIKCMYNNYILFIYIESHDVLMQCHLNVQ